MGYIKKKDRREHGASVGVRQWKHAGMSSKGGKLKQKQLARLLKEEIFPDVRFKSDLNGERINTYVTIVSAEGAEYSHPHRVQ